MIHEQANDHVLHSESAPGHRGRWDRALLVSLTAAVRTCGGVQAFADLTEHVLCMIVCVASAGPDRRSCGGADRYQFVLDFFDRPSEGGIVAHPPRDQIVGVDDGRMIAAEMLADDRVR